MLKIGFSELFICNVCCKMRRRKKKKIVLRFRRGYMRLCFSNWGLVPSDSYILNRFIRNVLSVL